MRIVRVRNPWMRLLYIVVGTPLVVLAMIAVVLAGAIDEAGRKAWREVAGILSDVRDRTRETINEISQAWIGEEERLEGSERASTVAGGDRK